MRGEGWGSDLLSSPSHSWPGLGGLPSNTKEEEEKERRMKGERERRRKGE